MSLWLAEYGVDVDLIEEPALTGQAQNKTRSALLGAYEFDLSGKARVTPLEGKDVPL